MRTSAASSTDCRAKIEQAASQCPTEYSSPWNFPRVEGRNLSVISAGTSSAWRCPAQAQFGTFGPSTVSRSGSSPESAAAFTVSL